MRDFLKPDAIKVQYLYRVKDSTLLAPECYELDGHSSKGSGNDEIQLDLFPDYASNVTLYPRFQEYFRSSRPPTKAVWGDRNPFFVSAGAEALKRFNPDTEVRFFETTLHWKLTISKSPVPFEISSIAN